MVHAPVAVEWPFDLAAVADLEQVDPALPPVLPLESAAVVVASVATTK